MYSVETPPLSAIGHTHPGKQDPIIIADYGIGPSRPFGQNRFRIVPVLQGGQTFAEAMAGLVVSYVFTSSQDPVDNPNLPFGVINLQVTDSSTYLLSNGGGLTIISGPVGQQYIVTIGEEGDENILPDSGPGSSSGGNPAENVVTTITAGIATGYAPSTSPSDGASLSSASGGLIWLSATGAGVWVDGQPILAYAAIEIAGNTVWQRAFGNDLTVPTGANALGAGGGFAIPDAQFTTGPTGRRLMYVPATSSIVGSATYTAIYQIQQ